MSDKTVERIVMVGVGVILAAFFIFGVFGKAQCDIDKIYLACRFHPFSFWDFIGTALFTAGALYIGGFLKLLGFDPWSTGASANYVCFAAMLLGIILIWNA